MINKEQTKYPGLVVDNDDPDKLGRVQIYVEPLMHDWDPDHYPWAFAGKSGTGGSSDYGRSEIPENDSWIWVWHERKGYKNWFYGEDVHWKSANNAEMSPHALFEDNVKTGIGSAAAYPDVKFHYYKNGICLGVASGDEAEVFVYHPTGTFFIIRNDGQVETNLFNKLIATGDFEITGNMKITGNVDIEGDITHVGDLDIDGNVTSTGDVDIEGDVIADGEVTAMALTTNVSLSTHNHTSGAPGTPTTSPTPGS